MDYIFDQWKKVLENFQKCVSKDLEEIRKEKIAVQQIKTDIFNRLESGQFIRDDQRIVLSAPEIVIGNVDSSGELRGESGSVIIKGSTINLDGVGAGGTITERAPRIEQLAVDPGVDGLEAVVQNTSAIVSQAKSIVLQSNTTDTCFSQSAAGGDGIYIHSDSELNIDASLSAEQRKKAIEDRVKALKERKSKLETETKKQKSQLDSIFANMEKIMQPQDLLNGSTDLARTNYMELEDIHMQMTDLLSDMYRASVAFIRSISDLAEVNRQITALGKEKDAIKTGDEFTKKTTGAALSLNAEHISVTTQDGDGNIRENSGAGITVQTPDMQIDMRKADGSLVEHSSLFVQTENVSISTVNPKVSDSSAQLPAVGSVSILSKNISFTAVDSEYKDNKVQEKALTKDSCISFRAETMTFSATDTEGKATGAIDINAKAIAIKSMDVDKEKRTDKELAKDSTMLLLAEKMFVGAKDKKVKSKQLQAVSEEIGLFADKTLEAQQDEAKAVLQLAGGNAAISGSKTEIYGATTIQAKTEIKDELKAPKATIEHVEAKSSFKSTNISDGIPVPPPPASAKLSAKLKTEELKEKS